MNNVKIHKDHKLEERIIHVFKQPLLAILNSGVSDNNVRLRLLDNIKCTMITDEKNVQ